MLQALGSPENLYLKVPTADLEDRPSLPDEVALGDLRRVDDHLEGKTSTKKAETIENWYRKTEHKRHLPITIYDDFWK